MIEYIPSISGILSELITGLLGGTVVAAATYGTKLFKRKQIEAKFPVSGEYISFFEDILDGEQIVVPSVATIKQKGSDIKITNEVSEGRSWTLEGTILQGGHISGVYSADAIYDEGVGSFYLRINPNTLDGMWNGYDHANKITNSGRYWFRRVLNCQIIPYDQEYLNDILHTSANAFGNGYFDRTAIANDTENYAVVALIDGEFAGYCFGKIEVANSVERITKLDTRVLPDDVRIANEDGNLGIIKTIAIRRKFRGHGIGTKLIQASENELKSRGAKCIIVPSWTVESKTPIKSLLIQNDYSEWLENRSYWKDECEAKKFECVAYDGKCKCSVTFYRKGRI
ncbi:GNAT family N-acetyltransferase [Thalassospira xiamenensis]|uniref:GCN5-like N-acetyltransferase n=1 Tax=Thalassospira xiamenensis M-5 = DSM 17429 TaxID=1123366 RepID=A0AB72UH32_9PROT|nr:GNAT family N-acetyltransferase [Thalassospira xiamenensis]AJD53532.1 GCN5-like N-acetyltransferase [Thalassospira xiamenensis M-5 = DSM 17429]SIT08342.1 Acetyltransferase (GNAT) family protein [Thalassospira xiamenensis M-5 = DSM 17429]